MAAAETTTVRAHVRGRVQGVFYRASLQREARRLAVTGWVRNCPDGSVEFLAHGPADAVGALLTWARRGPANARVSRMETEPVRADATGRAAGDLPGPPPAASDDVPAGADFEIRY